MVSRDAVKPGRDAVTDAGDGVGDRGGVRRPPAPLPWRSAGAAVTLAALAWGVWRVLASRPDLAEALLAEGVHPALVRGLGRATGWVVLPVSVAEALVAVLVLWILSLGVRAILEWRERRRTASRAALRTGLRMLRMGGVLVLGFYLFWGWQYARPGLESRLGIASEGAIPDPELEALASALVERTNGLYRELHGASDAGMPTGSGLEGPVRMAHPELLNGAWAAAVDRWALPPAMARSRPVPRALALTPLLRGLGFAGVYVPWTGEALVMTDLPGVGTHFTAFHESAHQRGMAREADANAMAYLLTLDLPQGAEHAAGPRYAAALFLQRQALNALSRRNPEATLRLVEARDPGVQRDVEAQAARARSVAGPAQRVARQANDTMLRRHGIADGVANYGGSLWIVVALSRLEGVEALLP